MQSQFETLVEQQVVIGGYRLADFLIKVFDNEFNEQVQVRFAAQ